MAFDEFKWLLEVFDRLDAVKAKVAKAIAQFTQGNEGPFLHPVKQPEGMMDVDEGSSVF